MMALVCSLQFLVRAFHVFSCITTPLALSIHFAEIRAPTKLFVLFQQNQKQQRIKNAIGRIEFFFSQSSIKTFSLSSCRYFMHLSIRAAMVIVIT